MARAAEAAALAGRAGALCEAVVMLVVTAAAAADRAAVVMAQAVEATVQAAAHRAAVVMAQAVEATVQAAPATVAAAAQAPAMVAAARARAARAVAARATPTTAAMLEGSEFLGNTTTLLDYSSTRVGSRRSSDSSASIPPFASLPSNSRCGTWDGSCMPVVLNPPPQAQHISFEVKSTSS